MRLLVCHGYASNGNTFATSKAKALVKFLTDELGESLNLTAPDGPTKLEGGRGSRCAWWGFEPEFPLSSRELLPSWWAQEAVEYVGGDAALENLAKRWSKEEFDGVIGFSQGALMAGMLCAHLELTGSSRLPRFAILCNGFRSPLPSNPRLRWWRDLSDGALQTIPVLVVAGELDTYPGCAQSEALGRLFANSRLHVVKGGAHAMPKELADLQQIARFLRDLQGAPTCQPCQPPPSPPSPPSMPPYSLITSHDDDDDDGSKGTEDFSVRVCKAWARGIGCSDRGCPFRHALQSGAREERRAERARKQREEALQANESSEDPYAKRDEHRNAIMPDTVVGGKTPHGGRHAEFANFLVRELGLETLRGAHGVVDVAGGRAGLAFELHVKHGVPTTMIEPRETLILKSNQRRMLRKRPGVGMIRHVCARLGEDFEASAEGAALLSGCSALIGMHCDEATEPLVRAAIRFGKPFAVVPCCVFASHHPWRRLGDGRAVTTYDRFCQYLLELAGPGSEIAFLPHEGRNRVIFRRHSVEYVGRLISISGPAEAAAAATRAAPQRAVGHVNLVHLRLQVGEEVVADPDFQQHGKLLGPRQRLRLSCTCTLEIDGL